MGTTVGGTASKAAPPASVPTAGVDQKGGSSSSGLPPRPHGIDVELLPDLTSVSESAKVVKHEPGPDLTSVSKSTEVVKDKPSNTKNTAVARAEIAACAPMGVMGLLGDGCAPASDCVLAAAAAGAQDDDEDTDVEFVDELAPLDQEPPWEHWERMAQEFDDSLKRSGVATAAALSAEGGNASQLRDVDHDLVPAMPTVTKGDSGADFSKCPDNREKKDKHRLKNTPRRFPFNALVARPVTKKEIATNPKAQAAMDAEWKS